MQPIVLSQRRILLGALLLAVVALVAARFLAHGGTAAAGGAGAPPIVGAAATGATPGAATAASRLVVYVVGAVRRPGLYRLPPSSRVADAVARAGGVTRRADTLGVNLAAPVADGEQVLVPSRLPAAVAAAQGVPTPGAGGASAASTAPVQLSVATVEQLDALPGIGPVTAQKIVDYRTAHGAFRSVAELDQVPGIGPSRVAQLQGLVVP